MASPAGGQRADDEEKRYLEKLKQLQKYVDPLKRMIKRIETDEGEWSISIISILHYYFTLLSV